MHTRANPPTPGASAGTAGVIVPPIIRPCWSCSMLVLVEDAAESVSSAVGLGAWDEIWPCGGRRAGRGASAAPCRDGPAAVSGRGAAGESAQQGSQERPVAGREPRLGCAQLPLQDRDLVP